jgi:transposase
MPWKVNEPMNQRTEFVLKALKTDNFRALCQEYAISTKTGYKWKERFLAQGVAGMSEHSRRPNSSPEAAQYLWASQCAGAQREQL